MIPPSWVPPLFQAREESRASFLPLVHFKLETTSSSPPLVSFPWQGTGNAPFPRVFLGLQKKEHLFLKSSLIVRDLTILSFYYMTIVCSSVCKESTVFPLPSSDNGNDFAMGPLAEVPEQLDYLDRGGSFLPSAI